MYRSFIKVITLGCPKNVVDSERLMGHLERAGFELNHIKNRKVDILIINTCGFIGDAKEESVNTILEGVRDKLSGRVKKLLVMGCLSQRYEEELRKEIPEVDAIYGVNDLERILHDLGVQQRYYLYGERKLITPPHYAYLKISEGCERTCSFCAIPLIRGKHVSIPMDVLFQEATGLVRRGVREIILVAQDLTWYGIDLYGKRMLAELLDKLSSIPDLDWIRLHYTYPAQFPMDVLDVMVRRPNICKYLDIPFQHISNSILRSMRRGIDKEGTYKLIENIRKRVPGITLRTTLLTGYPGETTQHFEELRKFVETVRFERLGVFTYSEEENTPAASLGDPVPDEEKQSRASELMAIQQQISLELNQLKVGQTFRVLIDRIEGSYYVGRTEFDSPDIDNEVLIQVQPNPLLPGRFYDIKITGAEEHDLYGVLT